MAAVLPVVDVWEVVTVEEVVAWADLLVEAGVPLLMIEVPLRIPWDAVMEEGQWEVEDPEEAQIEVMEEVNMHTS